MADAATIKDQAQTIDAPTPNVPDRSSTLALAAVDDAYREAVKRLFDVLLSEIGGDDEAEAIERANNGLRRARVARATMLGNVRRVFGEK